ncbi:MAG: DEAD/DEAH box helicase [Prevotellaceae bacterium]|jgi:SNF2 family DNA or RNA helicase|nr:DEAD/DEAH box helicase [Prevotellaceae bacterium]
MLDELDELIKKYQALDDDSRKVVNFLALTWHPLATDTIVKALPGIKRTKLTAIIRQEKVSGLINTDNNSRNNYITNTAMSVWLFPLICNTKQQIYTKKSVYSYFSYTKKNNERLLNYLSALCFQPNKLADAEKDFFSNEKENLPYLSTIFSQSAYDKYLHKISANVIGQAYSDIFTETISHLNSFAYLNSIDKKLQNGDFPKLNLIHTEIAIIQGDFEEARKLTSLYRDEALNYFVPAIFAFLDENIDESLSLFEKGMKKQRRTYKNRHLPILPEIALFYLAACLSKGLDFYRTVFLRITEEKINALNKSYFYFSNVCEYCIADVKKAAETVVTMKQINKKEPAETLWCTVATGLMDKSLDAAQYIVRYTKQAFENKYYVLAYETAYLLTKWFPASTEYRQLFEEIAEKLNHKPVLSHVVHPDDWEKQLNSYFSLNAVQTIIRKDIDNGKTRVAYRFFPKTFEAYPIVQTRNTTGVWTAGRNVSMANFVEQKIDCMTEQDKRIAACGSRYSNILRHNAIFEMIGHPYVYLEESNILVELIAAQPVINVVKSSGKKYTMKCDMQNPKEGVIIRKETNTRYKVYKFTESQCEIIEAISNTKPIPEQGHEKLMQILKHFSAYVQIQSDLIVDGDNDPVRQVDSDSRIHIQLLPIGDGLKAELFVKPFRTHPPYCKPGRGGKTLIANENGEHVRVIRDLDDESTYSERILNDIQSIENLATADDGLMTFNNPLDALELLDILECHQDITVVEWPEGEQLKIRKKVNFNNLNLSVTGDTNWFELEGELKIDENTVLSISKLLEMIREGRNHGRFVELSNGEFLSLSEKLRKRLSELAAFTAESKNGIILNRFASASIIDTFDEFENLKVDKAWHDFRKRLETVQLSDAAVSSLLQTELRPYQLSGYQWMIRLSEWGAGACLADDMGLGKTIQAIAVLLHRAHLGTALVVSPVSVMPNWISEVNRFAPSLNIKTLRNVDRAAMLDSLNAGDLLIASYGLLLSEEQAITAKQWTTVILDEAHAIKNYNTKTSKAAMSLQADFRIILTGTPIQNHPGEIWNLFQFINPGLLGSLSHFTDTFIRPDDEKSRKRLKKLITPFILRRTKTAVLEELPPKTEIIRKITLSDEEIAFYEMLRRQALESLENDDSPQGAKHLKVLAEITRLRQACCNPSLVYPEIAIESTKLSTFLEIASELKENGHRALVFSQFVTHLSIVRKALDEAGYTYCYLDGSTPITKRESEVYNFQKGQGDFFLISLKAGGLGLNLTAADYVIHLDPWWNPAVEDQASDRAHRIGQNRPVTVYRLVAEQTIEEKIIQLHNTKRNLADSLLEGSDQSAKLSINELISLIKN